MAHRSSPTSRATASCSPPASASSRRDLPTAFRERCQKYIPCELVSEAPWHEVVIEGDEVDLTKLPIPLQFSVDARALHHRRPDLGARSRSPASTRPAFTG